MYLPLKGLLPGSDNAAPHCSASSTKKSRFGSALRQTIPPLVGAFDLKDVGFQVSFWLTFTVVQAMGFR
jgi:hypothetical protein